jgi:hypothetical protein
LIEVRDGVYLVSHQVIQTVGGASVNEAVSDPFACSDALIDIRDNFESRLDTVLISRTCVETVDIVFSRESENVERILTSKGNQLS